MSDWNRTYGRNRFTGNRVLMIEEQREQPMHIRVPLATKLSLILLKLAFWVTMVFLVPMSLLLGALGG